MLQARAISKTYESAAGPVPVLEDVNLDLIPGDALSIMGPSGSGKSTLLQILGLLDPPTSGQLLFDGIEPWSLKEAEQAKFRNTRIGFIFQDHCLLPQCTVLENVLTPTLVGDREDNATIRAKELIDRAGLTPRIDHFPAQLSGGEKQRVAIARALIRQPKLLLCDEPTGNLDEATAWQVLTLLAGLQKEMLSILMIVTHSPAIAAEFPQQFAMRGRRLERTA
ncbi:MAG: ABC transporter ATP-binding protein [Bryobacterales bacterium]|nr:ABC transporter ATP-binding protein [Bryobacterales bacterium]